MLLETDILVEVRFLGYLTVILFGIQLSGYFFYHYWRIQDARLQLNRYLLSIGSFLILAMLGALILSISRSFISNEVISEVYLEIAYIMVLLAPIMFLYFINKIQFQEITNLTLSKILMALCFIPILILFFVPSTSIIFRLSIIFTLLSGIYIFLFQIRLIQQSMGYIRNKLILIFFGQLISFVGLLLGAEISQGLILANLNQDILFFIGVAFLVIGFILMFIAVYDFPPIYEFEFQDSLLKLFIIDQHTNICLYNAQFGENTTKKTNKEKNIDKVFSGGIIGIDSIVSAITNTKDKNLNKIEQGDTYILLEKSGDMVNKRLVYALVVKKDLTSTRYALKKIKNQFESFYREILNSNIKMIESQNQLFSSFDVILNDIIKLDGGKK